MDFIRKKSPQSAQLSVILKEIAETKCELDSAYSKFQNVIDPDLIDSSIYEVNAVQKRYKFLLRCAKELS